MGGPKPKWDQEIRALYEKGFGAQKIANILGIRHVSTVSKRLLKMGLRRPKGSNQWEISDQTLIVQLGFSSEALPRAAQKFCEFLFTRAGHTVLTPELTAPYDVVVDFGDGFKKIQVKSSRHKLPSGNYIFSLRRTRSNSTQTRIKRHYDKEDVDYFFFYDIEGNSWLIPYDSVTQQEVVPATAFPKCKVGKCDV